MGNGLHLTAQEVADKFAGDLCKALQSGVTNVIQDKDKKKAKTDTKN